MRASVLFVDDEEMILGCMKSLFSDMDIRVFTARNADEALELISREEVAVIVSDQRMPGMQGIELLARVKECSSGTVRILMTGFADLQTVFEAINADEVFRFVTKPWNSEELVRTVNESIVQYQLIYARSRNDDARLMSLVRTIELKDPSAKGHSESVARYALVIADRIGLAEEVRKEIRYGCLLHDCGKIGVPETILTSPGTLSEEEQEIVKKHPAWGADVAKRAQLAPRIVNIVLYHHEAYDGSGYPYGLAGEMIPLEARIVTVADVYDALISDRPYRKAYPAEKAVKILGELNGTKLDPAITDIFIAQLT